jgi:hypothetical protein
VARLLRLLLGDAGVATAARQWAQQQAQAPDGCDTAARALEERLMQIGAPEGSALRGLFEPKGAV